MEHAVKCGNDRMVRRLLLKHVIVGQHRFGGARVVHYTNDAGGSGGKSRLFGVFCLPDNTATEAVPADKVEMCHAAKSKLGLAKRPSV